MKEPVLLVPDSRSSIKADLTARGFSIMGHLAKLYLFNYSTQAKFWRSEACNGLHTIQQFKRTGKLPSVRFIFKYAWKRNEDYACAAMDWAMDAESQLNPKQPNSCEEFTQILNTYFNWIAYQLSQQPYISNEAIDAKLKSLGL